MGALQVRNSLKFQALDLSFTVTSFNQRVYHLCDLFLSVLPVGLVAGPGSDLLLGRKDLRFAQKCWRNDL